MSEQVGGAVIVIFAVIGCFFCEIIAVGVAMEIIQIFNPHAPDPGPTFLMTIPLLGIAFVASKDQSEWEDGYVLTVHIFIFATALSIVYMIGNWFLFAAWLAAFLLVYAKKFLAGYHYLFVTQPIVVATHRAEAAKEKLDVDAEIADATIRRERARAALLDAEREVEDAKRRMGGTS